MKRLHHLLLALLSASLVACGGGDNDEPQKYLQSWGSAADYAPTVTQRYFPSVANQTTGVAPPGVAVTPALTPPTGTTTSAGIFANTTIRQFFRVSRGGSTLRLRLSNRFSSDALKVEEIRVALADRASCQPAPEPVAPAVVRRGVTCTNIVATSDRSVTVNGSKSLVVPKGEDIYTDSVSLDVPNMAEVAVSIYIKDQTVPLTMHPVGAATAYLVVGADSSSTANFTAAPVFNANALQGKAALATSTAIFAVVGLDVMANETTRGIVTLGDSITDGVNTVVDTNTRWGNALADRLAAESAATGKTLPAVSNAGINGNQAAADSPVSPAFGIAAVKRFRQDVLTRSGITDVIVLLGINDIGVPATPTPTAEVIAAYRDLIKQAHDAGKRIYFATMAPIRTDDATTAQTYTGSYSRSKEIFELREKVRQELNTWILTQREADGAFDFNTAVSAPGKVNQMLAANSVNLLTGSNDQLHPNALGMKKFAESIDLRLFQ